MERRAMRAGAETTIKTGFGWVLVPPYDLSRTGFPASNFLFQGDNRDIMNILIPELQGKVRLIYMDPPFATKRTFRFNTRKFRTKSNTAFRDQLTGEPYLAFMRERFMLVHALLTHDGALYVHISAQMSAKIRMILDEIFGFEPFHKQIIWKRTSGHPNSRSYANVFDVLLFYPKRRDFFFTPAYEPYPAELAKKNFPYRDRFNRAYGTSDLSGETLKTAGDPRYRYTWNGIHRTWRCLEKTMERLHAEGKLHYARSGLPRKINYLDEAPGLAPHALWTDIPPVKGKESTGFPTQKPERLLERIIRSSSAAGDLILDPFCGSGTSLAVAHRLRRRWIGIDERAAAVEIARRRLEK